MTDVCWYERVGPPADVYQGHLLLDSSLKELTSGASTDDAKRSWIVLSHSCDIPKIPRVLVARLDPFSALWFAGKPQAIENMNEIARGRIFRYVLLPPYEPFGIKEYLVCDLADVTVLSRKAVQTYIKGRQSVRLLSPYVEHLGYCVGRIFARVGFDQDLWKRSDWKWAPAET